MINVSVESMPLPLVLLVTMAIVLTAIELGFRLGAWRSRRNTVLAESEAQLSSMTGAHLALLAFIMAFSFSMAAGHYQERRNLIMADANAISTAHSRASLIDAPEGHAIADALVDYVSVRAEIRGYEDGPESIRKTREIEDKIWRHVKSLVDTQAPTVLHSLLIQSLNEVSDVNDQRLAAGLKNRVPRILWTVLAALLILAMLGIGYFSGSKGTRNPIVSTGLALSFSLVLVLIADLDRPMGGTLKADQSPIIDLRDQLLAQGAR